jgi:hypothetical protein
VNSSRSPNRSPRKVNFGSPGVGTTGHLGLALFMHAANINITHVPYRGAKDGPSRSRPCCTQSGAGPVLRLRNSIEISEYRL